MSDISYREYWDEVRSLAAQCVEEAKEQCDPCEDSDIHDRVWETCDGHQWVIYTAYNFDVLKHSENDGYSVDSFGADSIVEDGNIRWCALAFGALYADVMEAIPDDWDEEEEDAEADAETATT